MIKCYKDDIVFARFINYMNKSLKNKKIDYIRKKEQIKKNEKESSDLLSNIGGGMSELSFFSIDENIDLIKGLSKLNTIQQKVIKNYYFNEMSFEQISLELNISVKAVRQIKYRAILNLKELIKGES